MRVRSARVSDLRAVSRLAADLVRSHHRMDPQRFLLVEPVEDGYQWFFKREIARKDALILVAVAAVEHDAGDSGQKARSRRKSIPEAPEVILGYAYGTLEKRNWNDLLDACGKLNDIYVARNARRRGVGRQLLTAMLEALRARGAPRVVLLSAWKNPNAHAFFESAGFRRTMLEMTAEIGP